MGEHAEDILNGDVDEQTGDYIGPGDGYPRSLQKRTKNNNEVSPYTKAIQKGFPELDIAILPGNGINIRLPNGGVFTVWWKKGKWCYSNVGKWNVVKQKATAVKEVISLVERILNPPPKEEPVAPIVQVENNVQKCIDHLLKKAETIGNAKGADHKSATLLKMTAQELIQYL